MIFPILLGAFFYSLNHGGEIMNTEKYIVRLNDEECQGLQTIVKKLKGLSQKVTRAIALLHADANGPDWTNAQIAHRTGLTIRSITNLRKQLVTDSYGRF